MNDTEQTDTEERIIRLTGEITEESVDQCIVSMHEMCHTPGPITLIISSDGGCPDDGFRVIDAMTIARTKGCPVHTIASGKASSMGAIIFCAGIHRSVHRHTRIMIHPAYFTDAENGSTSHVDARNMVQELDYYNGLFKSLLTPMNIPPDLLDRMLREDVFIGADEAIRYGIAHEYETDMI